MPLQANSMKRHTGVLQFIDDFNDAMFMGYTPELSTGVWVGYDQPRSLGHDETGGRLAAPIWTAYMRQVLRQSPVEDFRVPGGVTLVLVDLDARGEVTRVEVVRWAGFGLDEATVDTVRQLHFFPAMRNGVAVPLRVLLRYNFRKPAP